MILSAIHQMNTSTIVFPPIACLWFECVSTLWDYYYAPFLLSLCPRGSKNGRCPRFALSPSEMPRGFGRRKRMESKDVMVSRAAVEVLKGLAPHNPIIAAPRRRKRFSRHSVYETHGHRWPFWWFWWKNRWVSIPGLPGGLIIYQGHLFPLKGHLCAWVLSDSRAGCIGGMGHRMNSFPLTQYSVWFPLRESLGSFPRHGRTFPTEHQQGFLPG